MVPRRYALLFFISEGLINYSFLFFSRRKGNWRDAQKIHHILNQDSILDKKTYFDTEHSGKKCLLWSGTCFCTHWANFSKIVYIAVRIHVMFDYMKHNIRFFHWKKSYVYVYAITNLQRAKLDYFMFHFMLCFW